MHNVADDPRFRIAYNKIIIDGMHDTYRLMQLSDAHLSPDSPLDDKETRDKAAKHREIWLAHGNGLTQEENFDALTAFGREQHVDRFVYAGDMMDFPSVGTADEVTKRMNNAGPYLFAPGNHEAAHAYPDFFKAATNGTPAFQTCDCGEFVLAAVDNAAHSVPRETLDALDAVLHGDKPVILLHHTPVDCDTLHPAAVDYWQDPTYFLFGMPQNGESIDAYIRLVSKEHTQLTAVLAGHLHFDHVDTFENGVTQYVSAPCLAGYGRIIDITGDV